jgi:hypothetical protein
MWAVNKFGGDIASVWKVVMWAVSKWGGGDIAWVWSVVMWAVSKLGRFSVVMERSDVGSEQVGAI